MADKRFAERIILTDDEQQKVVDIYSHDIFYYADEFIDIELEGTKDRNILKSYFEEMIYYIKDRIKAPDKNNLDLLNYIFYNIYLKLCSKCDIIPTLEAFGWLVSIDATTFTSWLNGETRKLTSDYSQAVKKWKDTCAGKLRFILTQSKGGDINRIFIAKAAYGMAETAPVPAIERHDMTLDNRQLAARLGGRVEALEDTRIIDEVPNEG